ncbi:hypothetical protein C1I93_20080 [Micromonospora endophytica]|uniref:Uncharacterized protein n=1 Tax=Micromonospora endophytica TaxID=515350 RepID=A0A2W2BXU1_9ACTN|nr:hypothetical protein C1I93_20080 [Micromonospora endophytica]BCJ61631.1 hypothetical protein Jiend_50530 [Micromonospora endophytica]
MVCAALVGVTLTVFFLSEVLRHLALPICKRPATRSRLSVWLAAYPGRCRRSALSDDGVLLQWQ